MRLVMKEGTSAIVERIERTPVAGLEDGSITVDGDPGDMAQALYDMWLGASVMAKTHRSLAPFDVVTTVTRQLLHL